MAVEPSLSDAELRRQLSDLGYNVGPITDTTRKMYKKKLVQLQMPAGSETPTKSQGQKRKAKTPSPNGPGQAIETPSKRLRRNLVTKSPEVNESSKAEMASPKKSRPATARKKSSKAARSQRPIRSSRDASPNELLEAATEPLQQDPGCNVSTDTMEKVVAAATAAATAAAVQVLAQTGSVNQVYEDYSKPSTSSSSIPSPGGRKTFNKTVRLFRHSESSDSSSDDASIAQDKQNMPSSPHVGTGLLGQASDERRKSEASESLCKLYPDAHKFIEEVWYSPQREQRMRTLLEAGPMADFPHWRIPEFDPELLELVANKGNFAALQTADGALRSAQSALQNAAGPIYALINACISSNGILTKKLVKDCVRDSLTFVSCAYETLGSESKRLRQQQLELCGVSPRKIFSETSFGGHISNESAFRQRVANAMGNSHNTSINQRSSQRRSRF